MAWRNLAALVVATFLTACGPRATVTGAPTNTTLAPSPAAAQAPPAVAYSAQPITQAAFDALKAKLKLNSANPDSDAADLQTVVRELKQDGWTYVKNEGGSGRFCDLYYSKATQTIVIDYYCAGEGNAEDGSDGNNAVNDLTMGTTTSQIGELDNNLNSYYQEILSSIAIPAEKTQLRDAERRWIKERDAECDSERARAGGGTDATRAYETCELKQRVQHLSDLAEQYK